MRSRAAMEPGRHPRAAAERRAQRGAQRLGANFEVLRFSLAEPILNDLRQTPAREFERHERHRIRFGFADAAGGYRPRNGAPHR